MNDALQINREDLANKVIAAVTEAFQKLADHREDITQLWSEFANLLPGETIKGCRTKTEFAEVHLRRNIRSVQYLLKGGNHNRGETVSPVEVEVTASPVEAEVTASPIEAEVTAGRNTTDYHARYEDGVCIVPYNGSDDPQLNFLVNEELRAMSMLVQDGVAEGPHERWLMYLNLYFRRARETEHYMLDKAGFYDGREITPWEKA